MPLSSSSAVVPLLLLALCSTTASAQCSFNLAPKYPAPVVANGYELRLVATGLQKPRGMIFDTRGNLLVVQSGKGITAHTFSDKGGSCIGNAAGKTVIADNELNHGIELSSDGKTLFASSDSDVLSWSYDPSSAANTSSPRTLVNGMSEVGHSTRTLLLSRKVPDQLMVSFGSQENLDPQARDASSGISQIKSFNIRGLTEPLRYATTGTRLGWGLRNSVGVAEDPVTGGIWSVENSADQIRRNGQDIHDDNPGEELNFHGYLNGTHVSDQGKNYGYPTCFAVWGAQEIPNRGNLDVGKQFSIDDFGNLPNDTHCEADTISPRLSFQAHMAPLDIKFNSKANTAWITFHGSWNRDSPVGYKLSAVQFANGMPVEPASSKTAAIDIVTNPDITKCPGACFRPAGMAWDSKGRLFFSSDSTGEIFVLTAKGGGSLDETKPTPSQGNTAPAPPSSSQPSSGGGGTSAAVGRVETLGGGARLVYLVCGLVARFLFAL